MPTVFLEATDGTGSSSTVSVSFALTTLSTLWVGADAPPASGESFHQAFNRVTAEIGPPLPVYRAYLQGPPWNFNTATQTNWTATNNVHAFVSVKGDPAAMAAGSYDAQIRAFAEQFPTNWASWLTVQHEAEAPDKGFTGASFVATFDRFYQQVKAVRPDIPVGPCSMAFQWAVGRHVDDTGGPGAWTPAQFDFASVDTYSLTGPTERLADHGGHMRWHNHYAQFGVPLMVVERGLNHLAPGNTMDVIADILLDDEQWMLANGYTMLLYWQKQGGDVEISGVAADAYRQIASRGRS